MRNPIRSEAEAFRFLIWTIACFAAIAVAAALLGWIGGVITALVALVAIILFYFREPKHGAPGGFA